MRKQLHIIYITGLGDENPTGQRLAVSIWRLWRVESELFQSNWSDSVAWQDKFTSLLGRIDQLHSDGKRVGLVGASAGASVAINAFAARKDDIVGLVLLAGKVNRPGAVGGGYHQRFPAFIDSLNECQASLKSLNDVDRGRILSRYAYYDGIVSKVDSRISGARNQTRPVIGHVPLIASQIFLGAPSFLRFLKKQSKIDKY